MPRQARIAAAGALHHIVIRGIERRGIFEDDTDREDFLERLSGLLQATVTPCYDPDPASKSNKSTLKQRPQISCK
jgi:putative transposase